MLETPDFELATNSPTLRPVWTTLRQERRWLLGAGLAGLLLSLILAFVLPERYTATVRLLPELQAAEAINWQPFRELAESFNIDLDAQTPVEAIRPDLYPDILESVPFALSALHQRVRTRSGDSITLYQLLNKPDWLSIGVGGSGTGMVELPLPTQTPFRLSTDQRELVQDTQKAITAELDVKSGIMTISAHMPDPEVAAQVVQFAAHYLQTYVRQYRSQKARDDEAFLGKQLTKAHQQMVQLDKQRLNQQDQTRFFSLPSAALPNRRLDEQYRLAESLYHDLAREHAKAQIRVQTVTPVFKILEPAQVPDRRSWPARKWIVLAGIMSGLVLAIVVLLARHAFRI
ncbi:hypothetical protein F5984_03075 [Rudanella paleaurantiibacter]|uniref:Polysaccharide chain length determinant N-terminal domain-containing protein n=1 Tax=Rudanella paleaurantiibacter TaxID=2614655 RepID=A0A7J5U5A2_9BACT|nr:Wzz/FepE/Etk N-terminal domain-containing protein [Rudanella paleaurantiibacter]KAB7732945.1 hypothetical protein F5984_03075 [Rudanella paleaurantiibacter]